MKRFSSLATAAALAGSLLGIGTAAQADSTMRLVPISPLSGTYAAGDYISFATVLNLGSGSFGSFSVPTAVGYLRSQFDDPATDGSSYGADITAKFIGPHVFGTAGYTLWTLNSPDVNASTSGKINGEAVQSAQVAVGHPNTAVKINGVNTTLAVPAGTYSLAIFSFTVASTYKSGPLTLFLPTPLGFSDSSFDTDGAFVNGFGPTYLINGKSRTGDAIAEPLSFPLAGQMLTFNSIAAVPEPGSVALLFGMATVGVSILRKRRKG